MEDITREDSNITIIIILILFILLLIKLGLFQNNGILINTDYTILNFDESNLMTTLINTQLTHYAGGLYSIYEHYRDKIFN